MSDDTRRRSRVGSKRQLASGRWQVRVSAGYRHDGRKRTVCETVDTEEEADRRIMEISVELGQRPDLGRGLTLSDYWGWYESTKGRRLVRATLERYRTEMVGTWLPRLGWRDVTSIGFEDVQEGLLSRGTRSRAQEARKALSAVLGQAVRDGALASNPCRLGGYELPGDVGPRWEVDESAWEDDPFGAIEGRRDVWDARTVVRAMARLRGLPIEAAWLAMVGAGLGCEEAYALRWLDVRRVEVGGRMVTQVAVHHAETRRDGRKRTKTGMRRVRITAVAEPFGERLWELRGEPQEKLMEMSLNNVSRRWRRMWDEPSGDPRTPHSPATHTWVGRMLADPADPEGDPALPFLPLGRMRATHVTLMQQAGVLDSVNAAAHGHSQRVSYTNYQRPDTTGAAGLVGDLLMLEGGLSDAPARLAAGA